MALQRELIIQKALELLNEHGLDHLTMRKLAESLDVQPGALYWHFTSKQELLDAMAEEMLQQLGVDSVANKEANWQQLLENEVGLLRETLLRYRDGAAVVMATDPNNVQAYGRFTGKVIQRLIDAGFSETKATYVVGAASIYTLGITLMERSPLNSGHSKGTPDIEQHNMQAFFTEGLHLLIKGATH